MMMACAARGFELVDDFKDFCKIGCSFANLNKIEN